MTSELRVLLKKEHKENLYDEICRKIDEIANDDNIKKKDFHNAIIGIIKSDINKMNKRKYPWSTTETFFRIKFFWNKLVKKQNTIMERYNDYKILDGLAEITGILYPKYNFKIDEGILGPNDPDKNKKTIEDLNSKGYHIFKNKLSEEICDNIVKAIGNKPFWNKNKQGLVNGLQFDKAKGNTYYIFKQQYASDVPEIQEVLMDPTLLNVVQEFLKGAPILTSCNIWWSVNFNKNSGELSRAAQSYHQDMEFIKFVKVFVYLNDVKAENGPHVYVPGSVKNLQLPDKYAASQRISDEFIEEKYGKDTVKEFVGEKGTVIIEDTYGYHKGKPVDEGHRTILQLCFAVSLHTGRIDLTHPREILYNNKKYSKKLKGMIDKFPRMFSQHYLK